jgi:putative membrane protein
VAALVLGFLNAVVRPLLIMLTLPLSVLSLGFFTLLINAFLFSVAGKIVKGFAVTGFWSAFWAALLFSVASAVLSMLLVPDPSRRRVIHRTTDRRNPPPGGGNVIDIEGEVRE